MDPLVLFVYTVHTYTLCTRGLEEEWQRGRVFETIERWWWCEVVGREK